MANLKNLSERIKSVTSIQQVTKAMKMVAAAKVKKAQDKMEISRPYSKNTQELICRILPQISSTDISLVEKRDVKNIGIIVISSDSCLLYTSPSPRDRTRSRMPSSA